MHQGQVAYVNLIAQVYTKIIIQNLYKQIITKILNHIDSDLDMF